MFIENMEQVFAIIEKDPYGPVSNTAAVMSEGWATSFNAIMEKAMEAGSYLLYAEAKEMIGAEAKEWGFLVDNDGKVITGIDHANREVKSAAADSGPTMPVVTLTRTQGEYPVASHGGPALSVTWTLAINGVVIDRDNDRYHWSIMPGGNERLGAEPPKHLANKRDELVKALTT